ncbi:MAG: hypothetical protein JWO91_3427 [Acidobacteriaceae bacterium]|nr:hypothetical protein [Acidobacteriaceae bacterium]
MSRIALQCALGVDERGFEQWIKGRRDAGDLPERSVSGLGLTGPTANRRGLGMQLQMDRVQQDAVYVLIHVLVLGLESQFDDVPSSLQINRLHTAESKI